MRKLICEYCKKEIDSTPYLELHEWTYSDHGELMCISEFYCDIKCLDEKYYKRGLL